MSRVAVCGVRTTYIKGHLLIAKEIRQTCLCQQRELRKISNFNKNFFKMEYLQQVFNKILGYDDCDINNPPVRKIVAFGNVLLDTTATLSDLKLLEQFNLAPDSKGELDAEVIAKITATACEELTCSKNPGGSALNTARILGKLGTQPLFFGAIGVDDEANVLKSLLLEHMVDTRLHHIDDAPTGQCIALVYNDKVTLYANIGASAKFSVEELKRDEELKFLRPIERKQIIYIEGFFIPHREAVCDYIVQNYIHDRRRLAVNLSGAYIVKENSAQIVKMVNKAYFVFGNQTEFQALMEAMGCETEGDLAKLLTNQGRLVKIIVITKGADGLTLITNSDGNEFNEPGNLSFQNYNAQRVENVVDTTGAGDAFVAGFLHCWLQKRQLSECVRIAAELAAHVCTQVGCQLPESYTQL